MSDQRESDHTEDPRGQGTASGGYPESGQQGTSESEGMENGPEGNVDKESAPDTTSSEEERDTDKSTGNPRAAG
jgi:hypothetical protein